MTTTTKKTTTAVKKPAVRKAKKVLVKRESRLIAALKSGTSALAITR